MKNYYVLSCLTTVALLSGCASVKPSVIKATNNSSIGVLYQAAPKEFNDAEVYSDPYLREVTPVHSATGIGLAVLSAALGSFNSSSFDKEVYKGNLIKTLKNPTLDYFKPKANQVLKAWLDNNGAGYAYQQPLNIGYSTWTLIYKNLNSTDSLYELKYKVSFYKKPEKGSIFSGWTKQACSPAPVEANLDDWRNNNYAKVKVETQHLMDQCLQQFEQQLPVLLKK
ncbi:hypothetical protein SAMN05216522_105135 [Rosenbergiella nectarea]|uniref:Lipoprotein n=1 Tax=Rosenbergiella nectarea TaxID=988801 RepID=A0A1H9HZF1_9GAMM|nr:hypothetical protein [Rosenbergiella nectarea]SEQ67637.1 hypothetical protein SAMN05216522_105135 [Rosenbergiella nectarea]